ncbi:MAG: hypothetical protein IJH25_07875 [Clostridia bacterium]|nr:hypothetical protein [Clostridia bacterium]
MKQLAFKQADGTKRVYKNAELIPAFLMIPNCLLEKTNKEMRTLKRVPRDLFLDPETIRRVESDNFLQVVIDCYAYVAWPYLKLGKNMEDYSGYDPGWLVAHAAPLWIDALEDLELLPDAGAFYRAWQTDPDTEIGFCSMEYMSAVMRLAVQKVMVEGRYPEFFEVVKQHRCFEDYDRRHSRVKIDFWRRWYHTRTKHPLTASVDVIKSMGVEPHAMQSNTDHEFEDAVWSSYEVERFMQRLSETDRQILNLRMQKRPFAEIAQRLGFKTRSAVLKRIRKIGKAYERFIGEDLGFSESKIVEKEALL